MFQPAHEGAVAAEHLHAVDAEVEVVLLGRARPLGDHQRPGDERRRLARPAGLDRQLGEVDLGAALDHLLAGAVGHGLGLHGHDGLQQGQALPSLLQVARRFGLAQEGQGLAHLGQLVRLALHAPGDPLDGAEEVGEQRHAVRPAVLAHRVLEQHGRAALGQEAGLDFGYFQVRRDRVTHAHQPVLAFQARQEVAQGVVGHRWSVPPCCRIGGSDPTRALAGGKGVAAWRSTGFGALDTQDRSLHAGHPHEGPFRQVLAFDLPDRVVDAELALAVDHGCCQGEDPADVLHAAAVERRMVAFGGRIAAAVEAPAEDRDHAEHGEEQELMLPAHLRHRPEHGADDPGGDPDPQEDGARREDLDGEKDDRGDPPVPELDIVQ